MDLFTEPERNAYVAFIDILGFSQRVLADFGAIVDIYDEMVSAEISTRITGDFKVRIASDAFILTTTDFFQLVRMSRLIHQLALFRDCLVRGGIGYGRHIEATRDGSYYVVSQALVHAVQTEKSVKHPCIAFHPSIHIPDSYLTEELHPTMRGIVHYDGVYCVCPFDSLWARSARDRVLMMWCDFPEHGEKFKWFIDFYYHVFPEHREA